MKQDRKFTVVVEGDEEGLLCRDCTHSAEMLHSGNPSTSDTRMRRVREAIEVRLASDGDRGGSLTLWGSNRLLYDQPAPA
jgi:hypothetical protein